MQHKRSVINLKTFLLLGLLVLCPFSRAKTWQQWARFVGPAEKNRSKAIFALKKYKNLDQDLLKSIGKLDQALALDTISALKKETLIPELLKKIRLDPTGFLILTLNSLLSSKNSDGIFLKYKKLLQNSKSLSAGNIIALLEPLGRLGEVVDSQILDQLLKHHYPEVREAVLLYARKMVLTHKKLDFHLYFAKAQSDRTYQIRQMIQFYLDELTFHTDVKDLIPKAEISISDTSAPRFRRQDYDLRIVFGYKDARPGRFVGDRHERLAFIQNILKPCQNKNILSCGFSRHQKDGDLFLKKMETNSGKTSKILLRIVHSSVSTDDNENRKNPLQVHRSNIANTIFQTGLLRANMVFYNGHSRFGGGPDFSPPQLKSSGYVDSNYYKKTPSGTKEMIQSLKKRNKLYPLNVLGIFSCASTRHFKKLIDSTAVEKSITSPRLYHYAKALNESEKELNKFLTSIGKGSGSTTSLN